MIDIIKVELYRIKKSKLFWVMFGLTVASPVLSVLVYLLIAGAVNIDGSIKFLLHNSGLTLNLVGDMAQILSDSAMWALIATAVIFSKEFVDGTMRNVLLANKSRTQLYFAYLLTSLGVSVTFLTAYFATTLIIAAPIFQFDALSATEALTACFCSFALGIVASMFVQSCMCMFMFGMRKQWAAIVLPLLICMFAPSIIQGVANLIISLKMLNGMNVSTNALRWIPFAVSTLYDAADIDGVVVGMNVLYMSIFTAVFVVSGYFTFKKADLK